jgi:alpha-glucosidase
MRLLDSAGEVLCFERSLNGERLLCVFNLGHDAAPWTRPSGFSVVEQVNIGSASPGQLPPMAGLVLAPEDARG